MNTPPPGYVDTGLTIYDVPIDPDDSTCHTHVGRPVYRNDAGDVWPPPPSPPDA